MLLVVQLIGLFVPVVQCGALTDVFSWIHLTQKPLAILPEEESVCVCAVNPIARVIRCLDSGYITGQKSVELQLQPTEGQGPCNSYSRKGRVLFLGGISRAKLLVKGCVNRGQRDEGSSARD